jgi:hypothetical protein
MPTDLPRAGNELRPGLRAHFDPRSLKDRFTEGSTFVRESTKVCNRPGDPGPEHRRFVEFADAVRRQHTIGICFGGVGLCWRLLCFVSCMFMELFAGDSMTIQTLKHSVFRVSSTGPRGMLR